MGRVPSVNDRTVFIPKFGSLAPPLELGYDGSPKAILPIDYNMPNFVALGEMA